MQTSFHVHSATCGCDPDNLSSDGRSGESDQRPRVVIVGAGFGGLSAAKALRKADVRVTLVDRRNHHLFQPLLYQVATAGLSPGQIATPIRTVLRDQKNAEVVLGTVSGVDVARRVVKMGGHEINYDYLVLATGARHSYFGRDEWEQFAPGLKSLEDATELRKRILLAFEPRTWKRRRRRWSRLQPPCADNESTVGEGHAHRRQQCPVGRTWRPDHRACGQDDAGDQRFVHAHRRHHRHDRRHRLPDQHPGAERGSRGGPCGRAGPRLRGRGLGSSGAGAALGSCGARDQDPDHHQHRAGGNRHPGGARRRHDDRRDRGQFAQGARTAHRSGQRRARADHRHRPERQGRAGTGYGDAAERRARRTDGGSPRAR